MCRYQAVESFITGAGDDREASAGGENVSRCNGREVEGSTGNQV